MATSIGTAWIQIKPTTKGIQSAIKKELTASETSVASSTGKMEGQFDSLGSKAGNALKTGMLVASAGAVAGIASLVKSSVTQFADYEQLVGGVDTLFKGASDTVQDYAAQAFKTAQVSANEYMETVTSFSASLIQSLGGDTDKAAEYANRAVIDMADNANKMGTDMESIQNAYQGFAKQNYTMLDNLKLGYGGTKTEMERLLEDAEAISGVEYDINSFADVTAAIHVIQEDLGIAGTSAKEANETITGSLNSMESAWSNLLTGLADGDADLTTLFGNLFESFGTFLNNLIPVISTAITSLAQAIPQFIPPLLEAIIAVAPSLFEGVVQLVLGIVNMLPQLVPILASAIPTLIIGIISTLTSPETLTSLFKAAYDLLYQLVLAVPEIVIALSEALPDLILNLVDFLNKPETIAMVIGASVTLFMAIVKAVPRILGALLKAFGTLFAGLWDTLTNNFGRFAASFGEFLGGVFKGAINGVLAFIENFINSPIRLINGFISLINKAFGFIGVNLGSIALISLPRLATGGIVEGIGTSTSDSNIYALSKGEYVIRAAAAQNIGYENLDRMNETGEVDSAGEARNNISIIINGYNRSPDELANIISRKIALKTQGVLA